MISKIIEATNPTGNWGKFMVLRPDTEWARTARVGLSGKELPRVSLLRQVGWDVRHIWVLDLQTGEGAFFFPGGHASADLNKHKIWVCPLFEHFLGWLYQQNLDNITKLPDLIELPEAPFSMHGYRRGGRSEPDPEVQG